MPGLAPAPIVTVSRRSAELIKYAANSYLAMRLSFINEIADLCDAAGGDVDEVALGIGLDSRIGSKYLRAGAGYGGSCLPKDTREFVATGRSFGAPLTLIEAAVAVNEGAAGEDGREDRPARWRRSRRGRRSRSWG